VKVLAQHCHFEGQPLQTVMKDQHLVVEGNETSSSHIGNQTKDYIQVEDVVVNEKLEGLVTVENRVILVSKIPQKESIYQSLQFVGIKEKEQLLKLAKFAPKLQLRRMKRKMYLQYLVKLKILN